MKDDDAADDAEEESEIAAEESETDEEEEAESSDLDDDLDIEAKKIRFKNPILDKISRGPKNAGRILIKVIPVDQRTTSHRLSITECTEAIGLRATQIETNPIVFTDVEGYTDPIAMAEKELYDRKSPLILQREVCRHDNLRWVERWDLNEMTLPVIQTLKPTIKKAVSLAPITPVNREDVKSKTSKADKADTKQKAEKVPKRKKKE